MLSSKSTNQKRVIAIPLFYVLLEQSSYGSCGSGSTVAFAWAQTHTCCPLKCTHASRMGKLHWPHAPRILLHKCEESMPPASTSSVKIRCRIRTYRICRGINTILPVRSLTADVTTAIFLKILLRCVALCCVLPLTFFALLFVCRYLPFHLLSTAIASDAILFCSSGEPDAAAAGLIRLYCVRIFLLLPKFVYILTAAVQVCSFNAIASACACVSFSAAFFK